METNPNRARRHPQVGGHLRRGQAKQIAKHDDLTLGTGQTAQGPRHVDTVADDVTVIVTPAETQKRRLTGASAAKHPERSHIHPPSRGRAPTDPTPTGPGMSERVLRDFLCPRSATTHGAKSHDQPAQLRPVHDIKVFFQPRPRRTRHDAICVRKRHHQVRGTKHPIRYSPSRPSVMNPAHHLPRSPSDPAA
jgi:hypothetical protein